MLIVDVTISITTTTRIWFEGTSASGYVWALLTVELNLLIMMIKSIWVRFTCLLTDTISCIPTGCIFRLDNNVNRTHCCYCWLQFPCISENKQADSLHNSVTYFEIILCPFAIMMTILETNEFSADYMIQSVRNLQLSVGKSFQYFFIITEWILLGRNHVIPMEKVVDGNIGEYTECFSGKGQYFCVAYLK